MNEKLLAIRQTPLAGLDRIGRHLDYHHTRQGVIASNVANLDTPGYRAQDVTFNERLDIAFERDNVRSMTMSHEMERVTADDEVPDQDGNTVSLEGQVAKMNANLVRYRSLSEVLNRRVGMLRYASTDGNS